MFTKRLNICSLHLRELRGFKLFLFSFLRAFFLTIKGFVKIKGAQVASSLTYYSLLAMVPLLALSFEIAEKLKITELLQKGLSYRLERQQAIFSQIMSFINNMLSSAKGSIIAAIGMSILFLSTIRLLSIIDNFFDALWKIKHKRKFFNKILIFILLILSIPFFLIVSGVIKMIVIQKLHYVLVFHPLFYILHYTLQVLPYFLICIWLSVIYFLMPQQRKIKLYVAVISGFIAGSVYELVQWVYVYFQIGFTNYSTIYSSFASLTLFLIWIQLSWIIFILGARLSYSLQHLEECEYENLSLNASYRYQMLLTLYAINKSTASGGRLSSDFMYKELNIPPALTDIILERLHSSKIFKVYRDSKGMFYKPEFDLDKITIKELVDKIEQAGINNIKFIRDESLFHLEEILNEFDLKLMKAKENILLKNL
jgi:membrane protein